MVSTKESCRDNKTVVTKEKENAIGNSISICPSDNNKNSLDTRVPTNSSVTNSSSKAVNMPSPVLPNRADMSTNQNLQKNLVYNESPSTIRPHGGGTVDYNSGDYRTSNVYYSAYKKDISSPYDDPNVIASSLNSSQSPVIPDTMREISRVQVQEVITYKPKVVYQERIEEVPEVEIVEVLVEKIIEVPEIREEVVIKEVPVNRYVACPVAEYVDVEVTQDVRRNIPIPVECTTTLEYKIPKLKQRYERVPLPIYAPRFKEIAVPVEQMDEETALVCSQLLEEVTAICTEECPSLCDLETIGARVKAFTPNLNTDTSRSIYGWRAAVSESLHSGASETPSTRPYIQLAPSNLTTTRSSQSVSRTQPSTINYASPAYPARVMSS